MDIEVPRELWTKFEEVPPLFYNKPVPSETISQHMKDYLAHSKRKPDQRKLVSWRPFSPKDPVARAAAEMVSLPKFENYNCSPNH